MKLNDLDPTQESIILGYYQALLCTSSLTHKLILFSAMCNVFCVLCCLSCLIHSICLCKAWQNEWCTVLLAREFLRNFCERPIDLSLSVDNILKRMSDISAKPCIVTFATNVHSFNLSHHFSDIAFRYI